MKICEEGHDEICFEVRTCPLCKLRAELENEIKGLENDIKDREENPYILHGEELERATEAAKTGLKR